jgi:hypothetical protein
LARRWWHTSHNTRNHGAHLFDNALLNPSLSIIVFAPSRQPQVDGFIESGWRDGVVTRHVMRHAAGQYTAIPWRLD